jgi:hypothetical protein
MPDELERRRRALEEAFFNKYNDELLGKLRAKEAASQKKQGLAAKTGISDEKVLDDLLGAGVEPETLAALALAPLILLAWRDGVLEQRERSAILRAADEQGLSHTSTAYQLLEKWLNDRPGDELVAAWKGYVEALRRNLSAPAYAALRKDILDRTTKVARSAGGFLGFTRVTKEEKELLARIEAILA